MHISHCSISFLLTLVKVMSRGITTTLLRLRNGTGDPVQRLPYELQLLIRSFLGYQDSIRLSQVNSYYHELVRPQDCPAEAKEAFLRTAQLWQKHNLTYIRWHSDVEMKTVEWIHSGFACYWCYRVRRFTAFVSRQVREMHDKNDPQEGAAGFKRCCVNCALSNGLWRPRTRLHVVQRMWVDMPYASLKPHTQWEPMFYCDTCKALKSEHMLNPNRTCFDCGTRSRRDILQRGSYDCLMRFFICKQCDLHNGYPVIAGCMYCKGPVCKYCGHKRDEEEWWCGRDCSREAHDFCSLLKEVSMPIRANLCEIMEKKRPARSAPGPPDMFDEWESEECCLGLLSL